MFGRVFLIIITAISLIWLGYSTFDRVNQSKSFKVEYIFGKEDQELLIVKNVSQIPTLIEQFNPSTKELDTILSQLNSELIETIYISKNRNHMLITTKGAVTEKSIHSLFNHSKVVQLKKGAFKIEQFEGAFSNNAIYLKLSDFNLNKDPWEEVHFDQHADASIIQFDKITPSVIDIYIKQHGVVEYKSSLNDQVLGTKVNDRVVFSNVVPASISSYEFFETDFLRFRNPSILESPINNWLKYGLVKVVVNGQEALITDYIDGQDPIQVLYDFYQIESKEAENEFFKGKTLTSILNTPNGFYIYHLDDYVVISGSRTVCESIVGDYKLGNTLSQHPEKSAVTYSLLPQKVNYRKASKTEKHTASVYDRQLLTTIVNPTAQDLSQPSKNTNTSPASFVVGSVKDIHLVSEKSFFVTTTDNKVVYFENDAKKWEQALDGSINGTGELISLYANDKTQLLIATDKKIHVFETSGQYAGGFPISMDDQTIVQAPVFYRWKGNGFFIAPVEKGRMVQFDNQGRELTIIRTQLNSIEMQPVVWVSANKPFVGAMGENRFEMIQLENRKSFRIFNANNSEVVLKLPNEVKLFGVHHKQLVAYDQRGGLSKFDMTTGKIQTTIFPDKGIVINNLPFISLYNSSGLQWGNIKLPFTDVADIQIFTTTAGSTFIAAIDGLENKVYLYKSNGELYSNQKFDGSKIVRFEGNSLFTVIDNLVVKYHIK